MRDANPRLNDGFVVLELRDKFQGLEDIKAIKYQPPIPVDGQDWTEVYSLAQDRVQEIIENGLDNNKDVQQYVQIIFEQVMKTIYGPHYFKWENEQ